MSALDPSHHVSEYTVSAWSMEDGLSHNLVHAVAQDHHGNVWVGSWEGAARFNGRHFTTFDARTLPEIPLIGVRTILRDTDDAMLFGTALNGVVRLADGVWSKLEPTVERRLRVISLLRSRNGDLWIGTDRGLQRLRPDGVLEAMAENELPSGVVFTLLERDDDEILIGSERGLYRFHNGHVENLGQDYGLNDSAVRAILQRRNGDLAIAGDVGTLILNADSGVQKIFEQPVESLLEDRDNALWLGVSSGGLVRWLHDQTQTIDETLGLLGRNSQALIEDREGLVWLGTTNGLYRINDAPAFGLDTSRGLGDNYPRTVLNHHGRMYVGHARGLDVWREDHFEHLALDGEQTSVLALAAASDGGLWVGTYDRGVLYVSDGAKDKSVQTQILDGLPSRHIRALYETADGSLWIGTTAGLVRRYQDGRLVSVADLPYRSGSFVRGLAPSSDGGLWIALANGLMRWHPDERMQRWMPETGFPSSGAFDVLETADGSAYIGTDQGLLRLRQGHFSHYDYRTGLPNDTIFRVVQDRQGSIWLASNHGAFRINPEQFDEIDAGQRTSLAVDILDHSNGMRSSQCNGGSGPAGDFDSSGRLWLPTALGVAVIDPIATAARSRVQVPVRIEDVQIDSQSFPASQVHTLAASANRVVLRYIGLHLRDPLGVRYRYRMLGFDKEWVDAGTAIEAVYTNLPPGKLRFEVQAAMAPVNWDAATHFPVAALELERVPPFWRRGWFYALFPLSLLGLSLAWVNWRSARYRKQQRRLTHLVERRTRELREKNEALVLAGRERESLLQQMAWQASHDALTGLPNRRAGERRLAEAMRDAETSNQPLCVALLDIDHFKRINDAHGHEVGDMMLRRIASALAEGCCVSTSCIARYGGEEFLLVLPNRTLAQAKAQLIELASHIANTELELPDGNQLACSVSIGVVQWQPGVSASQMVVQADRRLYRAKAKGRNQVADQD